MGAKNEREVAEETRGEVAPGRSSSSSPGEKEPVLTKSAGAYRIPCLDGIRAISILLVFVAHSPFGGIIPLGLGLNMFFFLSGYLITHLMVREYDKTGAVNVPKFYMRRSVRIIPPMIVVLIACCVIESMGFWGASKYSLQGVFDSILYLGVYGEMFMPHALDVPRGTEMFWTLAVEEHFYLVFPLLFLGFKRFFSSRGAALVLLAMVVVVLIARIVAYRYMKMDFEVVYQASHLRFDSILFGSILAMYHDPIRSVTRPSNKKVLWLLAAGCLLMLYTIANRDVDFRATMRSSIQGGALYLLFYCSLAKSNWAIFRWLDWAVMRKIGVLSYGMYLVHWLVILVLREYIPAENRTAHFVISFVITLALAFLLHIVIEKPVGRLKERLQNRP